MVYEIKNESIYLFSFLKFAQRKKFNDQFTFYYFFFVNSEKLVILFQFIIFLQNLITLVFVVDTISSLLINTLLQKAHANFLMLNFQKKFQIHYDVCQDMMTLMHLSLA